MFEKVKENEKEEYDGEGEALQSPGEMERKEQNQIFQELFYTPNIFFLNHIP